MSASITDHLFAIKSLLHSWLQRHLSSDQLARLEEKLKEIEVSKSEQLFYTVFSSMPRYIGKHDLKLTLEDLQTAANLRAGWCPIGWSVDQVGRSLLLLTLPTGNEIIYQQNIEKLFVAADVSELIALYQALPLLPYPISHLKRAADGIRSNMTAVFNAIALRNPYPFDYFDIPAWNQMILKAVFVGSPLHLIWQLDGRANAELSRMLIDYAHERWAANRPVTPELWRLIGPFIDQQTISDLQRLFSEADPVQPAAAALACSQSSFPEAQTLLTQYPQLQAEIQSGQLSWDSLMQTRWNSAA